MSYNQKDLLKFALDLYQKTKETGLINHYNKDGLESILEAIKKINPSELLPSLSTGGEIKNQQEPRQRNPQEDENHRFWKQEADTAQNGVTRPEPEAGNVSPISIYETARDVNIQAIIPGITSRDDLNLHISQDTMKLYGAKAAPGGGNVDNFHKTIRLPATVDPSGAKAVYRNGLLSISVPKKKPDPPIPISVKFE